MENCIIVRISSEMALKQKRTRESFTQKLINNVSLKLSELEISFKFVKGLNHFFLFNDNQEASLQVIAKTFGVGTYSPVDYICSNDKNEIIELVNTKYAEVVAHKSFCLRVKKIGEQSFGRGELERYLGGLLNQVETAKVNLTSPDITIRVDILNNKTFTYTKRLKGCGGFPIAVQGSAICLMSGGFDSAVAAWRMIKRGVKVDFLFCNLGGSAYERLVLQVTKVLVDLWSSASHSKFYSLNFNDVVSNLKATTKPSVQQVLLKRMMIRAAQALVYKNKYDAIVTGEAIAQVSSQTISNLNVISEVAKTQILRPLIGMDKQEIIDQAEIIGTAILSERIKEYCSISQGKPVVAGKIGVIRAEEEKINFEVLTQALTQIKEFDLNTLSAKELRASSLFMDSIPSGYTYLDCQPKHMYRHWHLEGSVNIDIHQLLQDYKKFDKDKKYLIYCPYGTQSPVAAEVMQQSGYEAYAFKGNLAELKRQTLT